MIVRMVDLDSNNEQHATATANHQCGTVNWSIQLYKALCKELNINIWRNTSQINTMDQMFSSQSEGRQGSKGRGSF